jgi:hypothetical protein
MALELPWLLLGVGMDDIGEIIDMNPPEVRNYSVQTKFRNEHKHVPRTLIKSAEL